MTALNDIKIPVAKIIDHLNHELQGLRTGRANPAIVEELAVEAYGGKTPLLELAAISAPEPRLIVIQPWDPNLVRDIERAISQSPLGINPIVDGKTIRLPFPAMTEARRLEMLKVVNEKGEAAKVSIRSLREDVIKQLRKSEKDGTLSEDMLEIELKKLQTAVDEALAQIGKVLDNKRVELTNI